MPDDAEQPLDQPADRPISVRLPDGPEHERLQFTVQGLLIAQAVCAVLLGLVIVLGIWGALAALIGTVVLSVVRVRPDRVAGKRLIVDLSAGIVMPMLCFAFDPGLVATRDPVGVLACTVVGYQIALMATWQVTGRLTPRLNGFFAGGLAVGAVAAAAIGVVLLPFAIMGTMIYGLGLLGFTPFLTASVYARNAGRAWIEAQSSGDGGDFGWLVLAGIVAAVAVPWVVCCNAADSVTWLIDQIQRAVSPHANPFRF